MKEVKNNIRQLYKNCHMLNCEEIEKELLSIYEKIEKLENNTKK